MRLEQLDAILRPDSFSPGDAYLVHDPEGSARELVVLVLELSSDPGFVKGVTLHDTDEHDTGKVSTWSTGNFLKPFKLA